MTPRPPVTAATCLPMRQRLSTNRARHSQRDGEMLAVHDSNPVAALLSRRFASRAFLAGAGTSSFPALAWRREHPYQTRCK